MDQVYSAQTQIPALAAIGAGDHVLDIITGIDIRAAEMTGWKRRVVGVNIFNEWPISDPGRLVAVFGKND
jgi:hypothetical protein